MFAKLFEHPIHGQILVKLDSGDGDTDAEVRFYVEPPNLGVCSVAIGFDDNDEDGKPNTNGPAWDRAEAMFNAMDFDAATAQAERILEMASSFAPDGDE